VASKPCSADCGLAFEAGARTVIPNKVIGSITFFVKAPLGNYDLLSLRFGQSS